MSEVAERYERLSGAFTDVVRGVPAGRWDDPSPCEGWVARDVVRHVIDASRRFLGFGGRELPGGPSVDEDPVGAWEAARSAMLAMARDPEAMASEFEGLLGRRSVESAVASFACPDVLVHTWDLATATGQQVRLDLEEVRRVRAGLEAMGDVVRSSGAFGPALEPPPGADEQTAFLAFAGRRAWS